MVITDTQNHTPVEPEPELTTTNGVTYKIVGKVVTLTSYKKLTEEIITSLPFPAPVDPEEVYSPNIVVLKG